MALRGSALSSPFSDRTTNSADLWERLSTQRPLPLRFTLYLSRRPNASLCPCLELSLPSRVPWNCGETFTVTRILDPEHRVPYITLAPILLSAGLSIVQGLLRFQISPSSFDLSLAGLEPWDDLWISLPLARSIAAQLGLASVLATILDPKTSAAWSLDEFDQGLSHNWRIPSEWVDEAVYSTDAITRPGCMFGRLQLLPPGQVVKTLISTEMRRGIGRKSMEKRKETSFRLHQKLVRWSSQLWDVWYDVRFAFEPSDDQEKEECQDRLERVLEDLEEVVVRPTEMDVLEWLQLVSSAESTGGASPNEDMLCLSSQAELAHHRTDEITLAQMLFHTPTDTCDQLVSKLKSILRIKMASLHHITHLSLPHIALPIEPTQDSQMDGEGGEGIAVRQNASRVVRGKEEVDEMEGLHAKMDALNSKLDVLVASQNVVQPQRLPGGSVTARRSPRTERSADNPFVIVSDLLNPFPLLPDITLRLLIALAVVVFFSMIIRMSID